MEHAIDYRALFTSVSPADVSACKANENLKNPAAEKQRIARIVPIIVAGALSALLLASAVIPALIAIATGIVTIASPVELMTALAPVVITVVCIVLIVNAVQRSRSAWKDRVRMTRFSHANALLYASESPGPRYPGAIFDLGSARRVTDNFRAATGRYLNFGNYTYTVGSGKNRSVHRWGFLALRLDRNLPHMVLDSRANNGLWGSTNLPAVFAREQVLSLEGDFDRHFTLYCPIEYERDALYVFTPDLMALLIDEAAPFDVEIVDEWIFVYSHRHFALADAATYQRLLRIVSTVGAKTLTQTDRYVDERVGEFSANLVAPEGRRLRRRFSWISAVIIALMLMVWGVGIVDPFAN